MTWENFDDIKSQLQCAGLVIDKELSFDARIQRWQVDGRDLEKRGWTKLREWSSKSGRTYIVGCYGIWQGNDDGYTKLELSKDNAVTLTAEDRAAIKAAHKEAEKKLLDVRHAEVKKAAQWAASVWAKCAPCESHDYLTLKQIKPHGLRILPDSIGDMTLAGIDDGNFYRLKVAAGALVVPMHDSKGVIQGLQFIYAKGHPRRAKIERDKEFWPAGMAMGGTFGLIGAVRRDGIMLIAEGYATAASLHEATGHTAAYAFSANNLGKAGKLLTKTYPLLRTLFCADDDYLTDGNPGCTAAANACAQIERSAWIKPIFPLDSAGVDARNGKKLTDFNDLQIMTGLPLVLADQVNAKLDELKWREAKPKPETITQGERGFDGRRRAVSVLALDEAVDRFAPLDDGTGKYLFDHWTRKIVQKEQMVALLPSGVRGDMVKSHPTWIERGAYYLDQVGFDPAGNDKTIQLNTWQGWPLKPKKGSCDIFLELIQYLCSLEDNSEEIYRWLLCWMAYPLQNPGAKMSSAIIMHGPQGTGKSTVFQTLAKIYGDYSTVLNQRGLEDKFNSDWSDSKLFILAEEVVARAEMWHIKNELKELVTGDWVRVNPKNVAAYRQRNHINCAFLSNEGQPLPLENGDRRHCVVWTPLELPQEFYDQVIHELESGGVEAFYHYLLNLDISDFHPKKRPPDTQAKRNLIDISRPSEERFVMDWIAGEITFSDNAGALPFCQCGGSDIYSAYLKWCRHQGEIRPRPSNMFLGSLARRNGWENRQISRFDKEDCPVKEIRQRTIVPSAADTAAALKAGADDFRKKPDETSTKHATRCFFAFRKALGGDQ